jgi:hypothetical protein
MDANVYHNDSRLDNRSVLVSVAKLVQCPQGRIPSLVWLETSKHRFDLLRNMTTLGLDGILNFTLCITKGKVGSPLVLTGNHCACRIVERRTKIIENLNSNAVKRFRQWPRQSDLVKHVKALRVQLTNAGVVLGNKKGKRPLFQINALLLCPANPFVGIGEFSRHEPRIS